MIFSTEQYGRTITKNFADKLYAALSTPLYHWYLLQLENYELRRYWRLLRQRRRYFPPIFPWRKTIVWTPKLMAVVVLAALIHITGGLALWYIFRFSALAYGIFLIGFLGYPLWLSAAVFLIAPVDYCIKEIIITRARRFLRRFPDLKIIGLAGSYGKTTVKEVLAAGLAASRKVLKTPENINTPLGIARLILKELNPTIEFFIVEMGEHYPGDIKRICRLTPPDIAIVTGINEAHLERLQSIEQTAGTIFEIIDYSKPNSRAVLNADDARVGEYYTRRYSTRPAQWYSYRNHSRCPFQITRHEFLEDGAGQHFSLARQGRSLGDFTTKLLGVYAIGATIAALTAGDQLGVSSDDIRRGLASLKPIAHRLEPLLNRHQNILVIDDSYNGNPAGVHEAIAVLERFKTRRKIFITPGLVEMGERAQAVHEHIGRALARVADRVILISNSVTPAIAAGLTAEGFETGKIVWFPTAQAAYASLGYILQPNDVILFQNDWGDNYV